MNCTVFAFKFLPNSLSAEEGVNFLDVRHGGRRVGAARPRPAAAMAARVLQQQIHDSTHEHDDERESGKAAPEHGLLPGIVSAEAVNVRVPPVWARVHADELARCIVGDPEIAACHAGVVLRAL